MDLNNYEIEKVHIDEIRPGDIIINSKGQTQTVSGTDIKGGASRETTLFGDSYRLGRILVKRIVQNPNGTLKVKQITEAIKLIESISGKKVVLKENFEYELIQKVFDKSYGLKDSLKKAINNNDKLTLDAGIDYLANKQD